jgi:predicted RNA-binding protein with RPS1 domain
VEEYVKVGDEVEVKLLKVTPDGKYELSRKALMKKEDGKGEGSEKPRPRR